MNVLGFGDAELALRFGRKGHSKFDGVSWQRDHDAPRIDGVPGWLGCSVAQLVDGGDHVVVLGDVETAQRGDDLPLTYYRRGFGTHLPAVR